MESAKPYSAILPTENTSISIEARAAINGDGIVITQAINNIGTTSRSVICTCWKDGKSYTTTKTCPNNTGNHCDCSDAKNPRITCSS
jgi:hypothetical protein